MQKFINKILKDHSYAIIIQVVGLIGLMVNLYLATKLYPLADTDRQLGFRIDQVQARVDADQKLSTAQFEYIKQQFTDLKQLVRDNKTLINQDIAK